MLEKKNNFEQVGQSPILIKNLNLGLEEILCLLLFIESIIKLSVEYIFLIFS